MYQENLLNIDLNEIVSKEVAEKIKSLEEELDKQRQVTYEKSLEIQRLTELDSASSFGMWLVESLRTMYSAITHTPKTDDYHYRPKQENQYLLFEGILEKLFGVKSEAGGWLSHGDDGRLAPYLAINYPNHKELVVRLLRLLDSNAEKDIAFIEAFVMPQDYTKEQVLAYLKSSKYRTNGTSFGITHFWAECGLSVERCPNDLILANPLFAQDEDVFEALLDCIRSRGKEWQYLLTLPRYNKLVTKEQIARIGDCLIEMSKSDADYDQVKSFIASNLKFFNEAALECLYPDASPDNKYKPLYWENFPIKYQMRFLLNKPFPEVLKILTGYSCTWTEQQKEKFMGEYFDHKNTPVLYQGPFLGTHNNTIL